MPCTRLLCEMFVIHALTGGDLHAVVRVSECLGRKILCFCVVVGCNFVLLSGVTPVA